MNERKGISNKKFNNFNYNNYNNNNNNIKNNLFKKRINSSLPNLKSVSYCDIPSTDFSSDSLRLTTQKITI